MQRKRSPHSSILFYLTHFWRWLNSLVTSTHWIACSLLYLFPLLSSSFFFFFFYSYEKEIPSLWGGLRERETDWKLYCFWSKSDWNCCTVYTFFFFGQGWTHKGSGIWYNLSCFSSQYHQRWSSSVMFSPKSQQGVETCHIYTNSCKWVSNNVYTGEVVFLFRIWNGAFHLACVCVCVCVCVCWTLCYHRHIGNKKETTQSGCRIELTAGFSGS